MSYFKMIKYHGTPITPNKIFDEALLGRNTLIPFPRPENLNRAVDICNKIIVDNGAFTIWKKGGDIDWNKYYEFLQNILEKIEFFFIPDVIDGTEEQNDSLISNFFKCNNELKKKGVPVWHVNESFERLDKLINNFNYISIGSAGEYRDLGTEKWHKRMDEAMRILCSADGYPKVKIHMLRCLNPKIFTKYPFYSGDSTNLARNHSRDGWQSILNRIEKYNSPKKYIFKTYYDTPSLFEEIV